MIRIEPQRSRLPRALALHGTGAALVGLAMTTARLGPLAEVVPAWLPLYFVGFAALLVPVLWGPDPGRRPVWLLLAIVAWAALIRAPLLGTEPSLSDDVYRYVWEGRLVAAGGDPFDHAPDDTEVMGLVPHAPEWERIGHPELPAIYPAGAQWFFALVAVHDASPHTMRRALVGVDLLLIGVLGLLLIRLGGRLRLLVLYAWHPLVAVEVASSGHYEPLAILPMVAGLALLAAGREKTAWLAWGAALATKYVGVLPALFAGLAALRRRDRHIVVFGPLLLLGVFVALSAPFALDGTLPFGSLGTYTANWAHNASLHALLAPLVGFHPARRILGVVFLAWLVFVATRGWAPHRAFVAVFVGLFYLSPVVHPWYGLWLIALLPLIPSPSLALLSGLMPLSYLAWTSQAAGGAWQAPGWVPWLEFGLPALAFWPELLWWRAGAAGSRPPAA
jgi:alpha-1,6-mannosyltransferase